MKNMNTLSSFAFIACLVFSLISCSLAVNIWDRASLKCANIDGKQIIDENSDRDLYVDPTCSTGEIVWRMTKSVVTLRFQRPSPFIVCFSSRAPVGFEKFGVYNLSWNNVFVGSPNVETEVCLNSLGNTLNVNLLSLRKFFIMNAYFKVSCLS